MKLKLFGRSKNRGKKYAPKRRRKRSVRPLSLFLLGLSLAALVWGVWPLKYRLEQRRKISDLRRRVAILKQENKELEKEIAKLNSDDYIEYLARKDLGLVRPGEKAYLVVNSKNENTKQETSSKPEKKKEKTIWNKVMDFLTSLFSS